MHRRALLATLGVSTLLPVVPANAHTPEEISKDRASFLAGFDFGAWDKPIVSTTGSAAGVGGRSFLVVDRGARVGVLRFYGGNSSGWRFTPSGRVA